MGKIYDLGIDVGSTTVKTVILDEGEFIYNKYERHFSKVRETVAEQLRAIRELYPEDKFRKRSCHSGLCLWAQSFPWRGCDK